MSGELKSKTVSIHNLGCKVNAYEAEAAEKLLIDAGCEIVPFPQKADIIIINTCTVTAVADKKSRQMLHRAKARNPEAVVIAMGCYAQTGREKLSADSGVDIIVGNNRKKDLVSILTAWFEDRRESSWFADISGKDAGFEEWENASCRKEPSLHAPDSPQKTSGSGSHTRAFVKVQDGCDRFCSYCIIPYARGRIRSRNSESALREIRELSEGGIKEVVLTGIHLSSYGRDKGADCDLAALIEKVSEVEGLKRIRLGSLEPGIITEDFLSRLSSLDKLCPHFHLSLQSGCDETLKRMNRSYTSEEYAEKCRMLREYFDRPALTTDVIAGFPGETEEEFRRSCEFVKSIGFFETHIFPYSRRKGTAADKMPGQVDEALKKQRVKLLLELNETQREAFLKQFEGEDKEVLFEEKEEMGGRIFWTGHTPRYEKIRYESSEDLNNRIRILSAGECLRPEPLFNEADTI